jgi:hypothetical protein
MRKVWALLLTFSLVANCFASVAAEAPPLKAGNIFIPIGQKGKQVSLLKLSSIKTNEWEALTGERMKWMDKIALRKAQRELRKAIYPNGAVNVKKLERLAGRGAPHHDFHLGGLLLGLFLGWVGVLVAYLIQGEKAKRRVKWAIIGFAISAFIILVILFSVFGAFMIM